MRLIKKSEYKCARKQEKKITNNTHTHTHTEKWRRRREGGGWREVLKLERTTSLYENSLKERKLTCIANRQSDVWQLAVSALDRFTNRRLLSSATTNTNVRFAPVITLASTWKVEFVNTATTDLLWSSSCPPPLSVQLESWSLTSVVVVWLSVHDGTSRLGRGRSITCRPRGHGSRTVSERLAWRVDTTLLTVRSVTTKIASQLIWAPTGREK